MRDLVASPFYGVLKEYKHWVVLFRDKQVTLGSVIIMSKALDKTSLGSLSPEAWSEFGVVCSFVETMIHTAFGAEKFNYLALMMRDPEVHFHVIPRYSKPVTFNEEVFIDPDWPNATQRIALDLNKDSLLAIKNKLLASV